MDHRALNRAFLDRQMLLERKSMSAFDATSFHIGFQSQAPNTPYYALWNRLATFRPSDLSNLLLDRRVVRIAMMRSTIFLVTANDCLGLRPILDPVIRRTFSSGYGSRSVGLDVEAVARAGREHVEAAPMTFQQLGKELAGRWPDYDPAVLSETIRAFVPLVQVPPRGIWGATGAATHTSAEYWLHDHQPVTMTIDDMVVRYFSAFGPASIADLQHWSGVKGLREIVERNLDRLIRFVDASGKERFDGAERTYPDRATPAPSRFLGDFDNALLSHIDRTHIISEENRKRVFTVNGIIRASILVDGFVQGMWKLRESGNGSFVEVAPFRPLTPTEKIDLEAEGERLIAFAAAGRTSLGVRFLTEE